LTPAYGGKKGFSSVSLSSIKKGDTANTQKWEFSNHTGTHVDFPYHFYENGQTFCSFPDSFWMVDGRKIQILEIDLSKSELLIKSNHIITKNLNFNAEILIIKTGFGRYRRQERYWKYNVGLSEEFADWILKNFNEIRFIGLDSISISSFQHRDIGRKVHKKLLNPEQPVLIIEDMDLSKILGDTIFKMICIAPMLVDKTDGSPCTILAEID